jgi:hypothetical protein
MIAGARKDIFTTEAKENTEVAKKFGTCVVSQ